MNPILRLYQALRGAYVPAQAAMLLARREVVLIGALLTGLALGPSAAAIKPLIIPLLGAVMVFASIGFFARKQYWCLSGAVWGVLFNYVLVGGFFLAAMSLFPAHTQPGLVLLALCPPAVAILPFSVAFGGDESLALSGTLGATVAAVCVMPLGGYALFGQAVDVFPLLRTSVWLIILPMIAGYFLSKAGVARYTRPIRSHVTHWSFFFIVVTLVGVNRATLLPPKPEVLSAVLVSAASCVVPGYTALLIGRALGWAWAERMSGLMLGTLKNYAIAGALAVEMFDKRAALPAVTGTVVMILFVILFGFALKTNRKTHRETSNSVCAPLDLKDKR